MEDRSEIEIKQIPPIKAVAIEGYGQVSDLNKDINRLYEYLYKNGLQDKVSGPTIGLFYTETGGKYLAAIPIKGDLAPNGNITIQTLPAIKSMSLTSNVKVEEIDKSFAILKKYQQKNNLPWNFPLREIYHPNPANPGQYLTEIQVPIEIDSKINSE